MSPSARRATKRWGSRAKRARTSIRRSICCGSIGSDNPPDFTGKRVVVIGGGNVAMDCARSSFRLGASEVKIVYRRRKEDMTALPEEVDGALEEGCGLMQLHAPLRIEADENGNACALWAQPQIIGKIDAWATAPKDLRGGRKSRCASRRMWWSSLSARASRRDTLSRTGMSVKRGVTSRL